MGFTVRVLACVLLAAVATTSVARADDDDDDEDGDFSGFRTLSAGVSMPYHTTRIDGHAESGVGPAFELALGRYRWQYLVEGSFATSRVDTPMMTAPGAQSRGSLARGGVGARWLARQFRPASSGAFELCLLSMLGIQHFSFDDRQLTRPELALGVDMQVRALRRRRLTVRFDARVLYTPGERDGMGFSAGGGLAW